MMARAKATPPERFRALWIDTKWEKSNGTLSRITKVTLPDKRVAFTKRSRFDAANSVMDQVNARMSVNDHVAGRLGNLMGAPVSETVLVEVSDAVRRRTPETCLNPGVHHGSIQVKRLGRVLREPQQVLWRRTALAANRPRWASLAILYGWLYCNCDHQFAFESEEPFHVWSFDHGYTIGVGHFVESREDKYDPRWNVDVLAKRSECAVDRLLDRVFGFSGTDLRVATEPLARIVPADLAGVVAAIPDDWHLTEPEALALLDYLERRRRQLMTTYLFEGD
jgi:hypothetical protein